MIKGNPFQNANIEKGIMCLSHKKIICAQNSGTYTINKGELIIW
jgi:hypothetical protein